MDENKIIKNEKKRKKIPVKPKTLLSAMILLVGLVAILSIVNQLRPEKEPEIITTANLKQIIEISELSTYECVYNGIASVNNDKKPDEIDYYVSYNAKVKAGIDLNDVVIDVNQENKIITVEIPQVTIHSCTVDFGSMDFIFINKKANKSGVTENAYKQCEADVNNETKVTDAIYELSKKNAENIIKALLTPFINQLDAEYSIEIK